MVADIGRSSSRGRTGLTLIELVVVIAVLVVLGGLLVQNLPSLMNRTHYAKCADVISALNNTWNQSLATTMRYPDVYDSLLGTGGSSVDTRLTTGLQSQLTAASLTTTDAVALRRVGITRVVDLQTVPIGGNVTYDAAPAGATPRELGEGAQVAQLNLAAHTAAGNVLNLKRHLLRQSDGSFLDNSSNVRYLVFGIGTNCSAVGAGRRMQEAPVHFGADDTINPVNTYQRYLVVFSLTTDAQGQVEARYEAAAGNDTAGPSSSEIHVRQFYEAETRDQ